MLKDYTDKEILDEFKRRELDRELCCTFCYDYPQLENNDNV